MTATVRAIFCAPLVFWALACSAQSSRPAKTTDLLFRVRPTTPSFELNTDITVEFSLKNVSAHRILATREASIHDLIYLEVLDARGRRVGWRGKIVSRGYPPGFFVILQPGQSTTFRGIVTTNGSGYQISKPGTYRIQGEFLLAPKEYFSPVSEGAAIPDRPVRSNWAQFSVLPEASHKQGSARPGAAPFAVQGCGF
jgi:hypothetical protein